MHTVKNVLAMVAGSGGSDSLFLPSSGFDRLYTLH